MAIPKFLTFFIFSALTILSYKDVLAFLPFTIEGTVVDSTNKPVSKAYVYTAKGEEEAITDEKGRFKFTTWQALPVTLTVSKSDGTEKKLTIRSTPARLSIMLP